MKVKGKAKQMFCMACVFVASFLVTVTAFAAVDLSNDNFIGTYEYENNPSQCIEVHDEGYVRLRIYRDDENNGYYSGVSYEYKLSATGSDQFYAKCEYVAKVNGANGRPYTPLIKIKDYIATGDINIKYGLWGVPESITIKSKQSNRKYVK